MLNKVRRWIRGGLPEVEVGEQASSFYDKMYADSDEYRKPFWQSRYYFLWTVILDRLRQGEAKQLLEVGCGSGQFAELLYRDLPIDYLGLDISTEAIEQARAKQMGGFRFESGDALLSPLLEGSYDSVVCTEVLEHIEHDRELLKRIQPGVRCLCTVPNFPYVSHVRHFTRETDIIERYEDLFESLAVWGLAGSHREGAVYFLFDGVRKG